MTITPESAATVIGTVIVCAGIFAAAFRRSSNSESEAAQEEAIKNWRELADVRGQQVAEKDSQIASLVTRMGQLEARFAALEAENATLRDVMNSGIRFAPELKTAMDAQTAAVAMALKAATAEIALGLANATEVRHGEIMITLNKMADRLDAR